MSGPCSPWVTLGAFQADPRAELQNGDKIPDVVAQEAITFATALLYRFSGRQFAGECSDVVRPCRRFYKSTGYGGPPWWWRWQQSWGSYSPRSPHRDGGAGPLHEITLGAYPIREVSAVRINGELVDANTYEIHDRRWLVRSDPAGWPSWQNLYGDPMVDDNTFGVWFTWGQAPDDSGVSAAKTYAIEIGKGMSGDPCNLPDRVQNLQMGPGQSMTLLDPMLFIKDGKTGIYLVDEWLQSVNPHQLQRRSAVINPDFARPVRRTRTVPGS